MNVPETRYARSSEINIAYQVFGAGAVDVVYVPGFVSDIELMWEHPPLARFFERLASFARVILFDKRGTGLSDRVAAHELPTLEERMDDVRAVMDAAGSERAALFGHSEGGPMCMLFAATYPARTRALVVYGTYAKRIRTDAYPWAPDAEERDRAIAEIERGWGTLPYARSFADTRAPNADEAELRWLAKYLRRGASPGAAVALTHMNREIDVRPVLPAISVPTLVLGRVGDRSTKIEEARYIAAQIRGARLVELQGDDHLFWLGNSEAILSEVEEFLTGTRPPQDVDRFLATVMFTDVVGGTQRAAELGDRGWRELIERHHTAVRQELRRHRGVEIDTAGDGFFATFDGPGRAVRCAVAIRDAVRPLGIQIRAGVHTGECVLINEKVGGIAVITGARIAAQAGSGEVLVSSTVKDLVAGSGLRFDDRGTHTLKGVPGEWHLFAETP